MSVSHRREEVHELLPQLRSMAQSLIETVVAAKICLGKIELFGGVDVYDFNENFDAATDEAKAIATARRDETAVAVAAAQSLIADLAEASVAKPEITNEQALLVIAKR